MKLKRYNIEQLKNYSVVLSPEEQLMLLGGYKYEEGMYGVLVFDDNNNLLKIIRYEDAITNNYSELADYTLPSNITLCTLSSGMTCFVLQNTDILAQRSSFTNGFTDEMIMNLEQYNIELHLFDNSMNINGKKVENSHYNSTGNLIAMETTNMDSLIARVHEVVHCFQDNVLNNSDFDDSVNLEYQAHVVSALFAIGKEESDSITNTTWEWLKQYINGNGNGTFSVKPTILEALDNHAQSWFDDKNSPASHYNSQMQNEEYPNWKNNYNYKWRTLFNALGIKVQ